MHPHEDDSAALRTQHLEQRLALAAAAAASATAATAASDDLPKQQQAHTPAAPPGTGMVPPPWPEDWRESLDASVHKHRLVEDWVLGVQLAQEQEEGEEGPGDDHCGYDDADEVQTQEQQVRESSSASGSSVQHISRSLQHSSASDSKRSGGQGPATQQQPPQPEPPPPLLSQMQRQQAQQAQPQFPRSRTDSALLPQHHPPSQQHRSSAGAPHIRIGSGSGSHHGAAATGSGSAGHRHTRPDNLDFPITLARESPGVSLACSHQDLMQLQLQLQQQQSQLYAASRDAGGKQDPASQGRASRPAAGAGQSQGPGLPSNQPPPANAAVRRSHTTGHTAIVGTGGFNRQEPPPQLQPGPSTAALATAVSSPLPTLQPSPSQGSRSRVSRPSLRRSFSDVLLRVTSCLLPPMRRSFLNTDTGSGQQQQLQLQPFGPPRQPTISSAGTTAAATAGSTTAASVSAQQQPPLTLATGSLSQQLPGLPPSSATRLYELGPFPQEDAEEGCEESSGEVAASNDRAIVFL